MVYIFLSVIFIIMVTRRSLIGIGGSAVLLGVMGAGATGLVPGVSAVMGTAAPRDLGVRYTRADYESGLAKIPGHTVSNPEFMCFTCDYKSRGSVPADATFTQEEFTAQVNVLNSEKGPISDAQIRFNGDGSIESSASVTHEWFTGPVYAKGQVGDYSSRGVELAIAKGEVGRIGMNQSQTDDASRVANRVVRDFFTQNPGLSVESLEVGDGDVYFKGTFPEVMEGDPNAVPRQIA